MALIELAATGVAFMMTQLYPAKMALKSECCEHQEPFCGGSHKGLMDLITENCKEAILFALPAKKWHWRARTSALYFAETIPPNTNYRVLLASSVLNLAELVSLRPDLSSLKKILYFHENQLAYPLQKSQQRDYQYGYNQILSSLVADHVVFNSHYNMNSFLGNVDRFIRQTPDKFTFNLAERIKKKSLVIYVPVDFSRIQLQVEHFKVPPDHLNILSNCAAPKCHCDDCKNPVHIVWPHRWEHDKGPNEFFEVMYSLKNLGVRFQLSVLGESFSEVPEIFDAAKEILKPYIKHWGFCKDKEQYYAALVDADVCVSTALHEFFGVAMLEAVYAKCYPLCPKRLVYEEIYPDIYLYNTTNQLLKKLRDFCEKPHLVREHKTLIDCTKYTWEIQGKELLQLFDS